MMEDRKYIVDVLKGTGIGLIVGSHILKVSARITLTEQLHTFLCRFNIANCGILYSEV